MTTKYNTIDDARKAIREGELRLEQLNADYDKAIARIQEEYAQARQKVSQELGEARKAATALWSEGRRIEERNLRKARAEAMKLAAEYPDIDIEVERVNKDYTHIWVTILCEDIDDIEDVDPFYGDHIAEDWHDALARVETYAKLLRDEQRPTRGVAA